MLYEVSSNFMSQLFINRYHISQCNPPLGYCLNLRWVQIVNTFHAALRIVLYLQRPQVI